MDKIKVVFMGTPEFSVPALKVLIKKCSVLLIVTQPDKPVGRKKEMLPSPVKKVAIENNIECFQPIKIRNDYQKIIDLKPDLLITCAYGQILPLPLLKCAKYGAINIHASILPQYRGSAPINWAIINGDRKTGITLMYMDEHMDTGDIISTKEISIEQDDNYGSLYQKLSVLGSELLEEKLDYLVSGNVKRIKQNDDLSTLAPMIKRETELLDFNLEGEKIINKIRGLNPEPLAYIKIDDEEIKIVEASFDKKIVNEPSIISIITKKTLGINCKDGIINIVKLKPAGKKIMPIESYLNGIKKENLIGKQVN